MTHRGFSGNWMQLQQAVRQRWPLLPEQDLAGISGERDDLMRLIKLYYDRTYGEIERELTEFELRDIRSAYASRPSLGMPND